MISDVRMREIAEKLMSELCDRLDHDEVDEIFTDLDIDSEELEYFGIVKHEDEDGIQFSQWDVDDDI